MTSTPTVEVVDLTKLVPYGKNAKKHPPEQITKLATSIKEFGWTQPIVVDVDFVVIAGHGRRLAALELGLKKVPVVVRRDLTKDQADALRLADNRVTSTEYDMSMIQDELQRLSSLDFDLDIIGFDAKELDFATADLGEMSSDFFVEDVGAAVQKQQSDNKAAAEASDDTSAPAVDALGFKRVTNAESRTLKDLMSKVETKTGQKGAAALITALSSIV